MSPVHTADELGALDATAQADLVRRAEVSPVEMVQAAVERAQQRNPSVNAIIHERFERALAEAATVEPAAAPFAGVPIVVKDYGCAIAGEPHGRGTALLRDAGYRADHDDAITRRLRGAGFVIIGRTNTPELATTITTEPAAFGPSRNPWSLAHSTGGSSGGSAAAVAAGVVSLGHGGDGGGSIRIPASECGLVGLKPSRGRISNAPDAGEGWAGWSVEGVLTRSVRDTAAALDALTGYEPGDPSTAPPWPRPLRDEAGADPGRLRVGVLDHPVGPGSEGHPECAAAARAAAALLSDLGHDVVEAWPAALEDPEFNRRYVTVVAAHVAVEVRQLAELVGRALEPGDLEPDNERLAEIGRTITAEAYLDALAGQQLWSRRVLGWWHGQDDGQGFDLLLTPTLAEPPPLLGHLSGPESGGRLRRLLQYTSQFNVTGQPAISLPLHITGDGLPIGVQLVAAAHREDVLVRVAAQLEQARPWTGPWSRPWTGSGSNG